MKEADIEKVGKADGCTDLVDYIVEMVGGSRSSRSTLTNFSRSSSGSAVHGGWFGHVAACQKRNKRPLHLPETTTSVSSSTVMDGEETN